LENFSWIHDSIEISWVTPWLEGMCICEEAYAHNKDSKEVADFCNKFERHEQVSGSTLHVAREMYKKSLIEIKVIDYSKEYDRDYFKDDEEAYYRYCTANKETKISIDPFK